MANRTEHDTMGAIQVPADALWGAQTERSRQNFTIGRELMPQALIHAFARLKKACAAVNRRMELLDDHQADLIIRVCDEILNGDHADQFPLHVWQTGSGTQTNMNLNEVIANRAALLDGKALDDTRPIHPNDHVNKSQSSNDTFPAAMHIAAVFEIHDTLLPAVERMRLTLEKKSQEFSHIIKIGRTHLQDATPLTLGQEISGWEAMIQSSREQILQSLETLYPLAIGGTAVGTGLNAPQGFGKDVAEELAKLTGHPFSQMKNTFHGLTGHDQIVFTSGAIKGLAANLMKIANDIRWLASGPRCGIGELNIPANEPGSSIMPGKINPTQAEAATMVACQVMGNDAAIGFAASQGNFELNVFKPVIIHNLLQSVTLLGDTISSFTSHCLAGIAPNIPVIERHLKNSLMLVTALAPHIGYDNAARIAKKALQEDMTLKEAAAELDLVQPGQFDEWVNPETMILGRK
ncbi:class II fumarate hydratase [Desulfobacter hydrogenophilus]|uniref:Fumarate hydratase class II n=1 Tax=Desulfobacter hydrogenophilus TaxID=2291 RepID=A0A328FF73_9BACT|nr:class II fumarate hydratase [Desulfobacter hydrogenophilus]NDY73184.1 class II fumarate hydratase [Desulfobacter hydrogenophilus]QBH12500.1 class II fumarate hydratase [Desulfobacter hydrogenophilus]RAM03234.1 class II fumarate hydratase [Desulfobacter hydrogenophilus]